MSDGLSLGTLEEQLRETRAELAAMRDLLSTPAALAVTQSFDGLVQVIFMDSCRGYDAVLALPGARARTDRESVVQAVVGRVTHTAVWPPCGPASHDYVCRVPAAYAREVDPETRRCRRCRAHLPIEDLVERS